jgi:hypothetical protein
MVDRADGGATCEEGVFWSLTDGPRGGYKSRPRCVLLDANLTQIWDRIGSACRKKNNPDYGSPHWASRFVLGNPLNARRPNGSPRWRCPKTLGKQLGGNILSMQKKSKSLPSVCSGTLGKTHNRYGTIICGHVFHVSIILLSAKNLRSIFSELPSVKSLPIFF